MNHQVFDFDSHFPGLDLFLLLSFFFYFTLVSLQRDSYIIKTHQVGMISLLNPPPPPPPPDIAPKPFLTSEPPIQYSLTGPSESSRWLYSCFWISLSLSLSLVGICPRRDESQQIRPILCCSGRKRNFKAFLFASIKP